MGLGRIDGRTAQPRKTWEETDVEELSSSTRTVLLHKANMFSGDPTLGLRDHEDDPIPICWPTPGAWCVGATPEVWGQNK